MALEPNNNIVAAVKAFAKFVSISLPVLGILVLAGWIADAEFLKRVSLSFVAMNPATAVAFIFCGIALWRLRNESPGGDFRSESWKFQQRLAKACALIVALIGSLKLVELCFDWTWGIDQFLFHEKLIGDETGFPNRMAPNTAFNFLLIGLALLLMDIETRSGRRPSQYLASSTALLSWLAVIGYAYNTPFLYGIAEYIPMALHTAFAFLFLSFAILCARPDHGLMSIVTSQNAGGLIARRVLPAIFLIQPALGWLRLVGARKGFYEQETGVAIMVVLSIALCAIVVLWSAASLNETECERRKAENEIKRLNENLHLRAAQLENANKELESFSYSVSHDLRAPLRHIAGFVNLLRTNLGDSIDPKRARLLNVIADSAKQMGHLIDDLLIFSQMGRKEMQATIVDPNQLVEETIAGSHRETEGRNIVWKKSALPKLQADPAMLRQVFVNLISNAIKYTQPRDPAQIEIGFEENQNEIVIFVRDNGVGFDMQFADKLFGVFQRLHRSNEFEGTGIGLANVRRIVQRHGGRTWAEAIVDGGATLYFSLPKPHNR